MSTIEPVVLQQLRQKGTTSMKAALLFTFFLCMGAQVGAETFPVASVLKNATVLHKCNAFFYTTKSLLTTASCVNCRSCQFQIKLQKVLLTGKNVYQVSHVKIHPNYTTDPDRYNVAILYLDEEPLKSVVYRPANVDDLQSINGTFITWRYSSLMQYTAMPNTGIHVSREIYYAATNNRIKDYQIGIMSYVPVPTGLYDEGTPFFVHPEGEELPIVYGYFSKTRIQKAGKFFTIISIPYLFQQSPDFFYSDLELSKYLLSGGYGF